MLKAVEKRRAYEDVVDQVLNLIDRGKLKKGDQLPVEKELTETFRVSRTTVREAMRALESKGLIEIRQGDGTYVTASREEAMVQPLASALFQQKDELADIFHIRKLIEPSVAQLAAERATREEIRELEEIIKKQEKELAAGERNAATDTAFHNQLSKMAKSRVLGRLVHAIVDLLAESREGFQQSEERAQKSLRGHKAVLSAVKDRDGDAAKKLMQRHLKEIEAVLFRQKRK